MWTSCAKPIRKSQEEQSFCLLALMSILSLDWRGLSPTALNPFFLQWGCNKTVDGNEPEPMTNLHTEADFGEGCVPVSW